MKTLTALAIVVIALAVIGLAIWALRLKKRSAELAKNASELASKAEMLRKAGDELVANQKTLVERYKEIRPFIGRDVLHVKAQFEVTEEGMLKYKSPDAMYNVAKNRMATTIGNDIVRNLEPFAIEKDGSPLPVYEYRLKIVIDR